MEQKETFSVLCFCIQENDRNQPEIVYFFYNHWQLHHLAWLFSRIKLLFFELTNVTAISGPVFWIITVISRFKYKNRVNSVLIIWSPGNTPTIILLVQLHSR